VSESPFSFACVRKLFPLAFRPLTCMCCAWSEDDAPHWRPCPPSLCDRRSHRLAHRIATSARDYRYGGFRAWLRWIVRGIPADAEDC
jgi:hypothetical protein